MTRSLGIYAALSLGICFLSLEIYVPSLRMLTFMVFLGLIRVVLTFSTVSSQKMYFLVMNMAVFLI